MKNKIEKKLLAQRKRKRTLWVFAGILVVILVGAICSLEGPDAKLEDGQGNIVIGNQGVDLTEHLQNSEQIEEIAEKQEFTGKSQEEHLVKEEKKENANAKILTEQEKKKTSAEDVKIDNTSDPTASNGGNRALKPKNPENVSVTVEIRCDTLSQNMNALENEAIREYIPKDGTILAKTTYLGTTENTVFDALNTLCRNNEIQIEFSYTPLYESYYIEGIGYLYEFDGGPQSGWMYKVNGWYPNYGCSSYYLRDGDEIVWAYTCVGLGKDIGADDWQ